MPKGTSGILLLLLAMFLLMLAFSGRFHDIFTAAFPSLKGTDTSGSTPGGTSSGTVPPVYGGSTGQPFVGDPGTPPATADYTKSVYTSGGYAIQPLQGGGYEYVTG